MPVHLAADRVAPRVSILLSATFMGTVGLFVRFMPLPVAGVAAFRGVFGLAWISVFMIATRQHAAIPRLLRHARLTALLVVSSVVTIFCYFMAIDLAGLAMGAFLLYVGNIVSVALMPVVLKEPVSKLVHGAYVLAMAGVLLLLEPWKAFAFSPGIIFGLLSAVALGVLNVTKKHLFTVLDTARGEAHVAGTPDPGTWMAMTWFTTLGLAVAFSFTWFLDWDHMVQPVTAWAGVLLGLVPTALAFTLHNVGLQKDKGGNVLVLSYAEPFVAALLQALVFHDLPLPVILGGALIILGNLIALKARDPGPLPVVSGVPRAS